MKRINITAAILAASASAAGIFSNIYRDIPWAVSQMKGQDAVTIIAAGVLLIASIRKGVKHLIISAGINAYLIYTYFFYALEVKLNGLFHIYLAITLLSLISLIKSISKLRLKRTAGIGVFPKIFAAVYLSLIAAVLSVLWNADIIASLTGSPLLDTPSGKPLTIVYVFDLTFVIPAIIYTLYLLKTGKPFGIPLCGIVLVKCVSMGAALLGMTVGVWFYGFELEPILSVFWFSIAIFGIISLYIFLRGWKIEE